MATLFRVVGFCLLMIVSDAQLNGPVLVLGSDGLIGSALRQWLLTHDFSVLEVKNREHIDLRQPNALDRFDHAGIKFAFFLACEVGGSKFIDSSTESMKIIENNLHIYQTVFPWLQRHNIPFVFTSSYLQTEPTAYGTIKRLGERYIDALGFGKSVRLWNVYGAENPGLKAHVLTDWIDSCLESGAILCRTDGFEPRQFTHTNDIAEALGKTIEHYDILERNTDLSSGKWISLRDVADVVRAQAVVVTQKECAITYSTTPAVSRSQPEPNMSVPFYQHWTPRISFETGVRALFEYKHRMRECGEDDLSSCPYVALELTHSSS